MNVFRVFFGVKVSFLSEIFKIYGFRVCIGMYIGFC